MVSVGNIWCSAWDAAWGVLICVIAPGYKPQPHFWVQIPDDGRPQVTAQVFGSQSPMWQTGTDFLFSNCSLARPILGCVGCLGSKPTEDSHSLSFSVSLLPPLLYLSFRDFQVQWKKELRIIHISICIQPLCERPTECFGTMHLPCSVVSASRWRWL